MTFLFAKKSKKVPVTDPKAVVDESKYPLGDGKIKNPADYFDVHKLPEINTSHAYDPRAHPTSISLSSRCHPQEVYEQAIVALWDPDTQSMGYPFKTMLNCRDFAKEALKHGDYERACILLSRGITLAIGLLRHPKLEPTFTDKGVAGVKKLRDDSIKEAAALTAVVNARWYLRLNGREARTKPTTSERAPGAVWRDIARSWQLVKEAVTRPESPNQDLVAQNLQLEESYVTPQPAAPPASAQSLPSSSSAAAGPSRLPSPPPVSSGKRRSSISKHDKDLPAPPPKEVPSESGFSFNIDYTESPKSATYPRGWEGEDDDDDSLPSYGDVLLEAYAADPSPPALVLALRRGEVAAEDMGLLSGANSSVVSLNHLDIADHPGTTFHSAASSAPGSDSEDGEYYSAVPSRNSIYNGKTGAEKSQQKIDKRSDEKQRSFPVEKNKAAEEEKKRPCPVEKTTADLAREQAMLELELEAVLIRLKKIAITRKSLPEDSEAAQQDALTEKAVAVLEEIGDLIHEGHEEDADDEED